MTCTKQRLLRSSEIYLLMVAVMAGPLLALALSSSSSDPNLSETALKRLPLNDALFTEDVLLRVSARSRIDCSKKCVETVGCAMCTFLSSPQGPPGHCRLHSQLQNLTDAWQNATGARSLVPRRLCDRGYSLTCGLCLKAVTEGVWYEEAKDRCNQIQGRLVMPRSSAEVNCVRFFMQDNDISRIWVGADDAETPGVYRWNDGTHLPDSSPLWSKPEPDHDSPGGNCIKIRQEDPSVISDTICTDHTYPYVCQKDFA